MAITYTLTIEDRSTLAEVWQDGETFFVRIDGRVHSVSMAAIDAESLFSFLIDDASYEIHARGRQGVFDLLVGGETVRITVERGHRHSAARGLQDEPGAWTVRSPMTGVVTEIRVAPGETVETGSVLLILEAMKMKNEMRATRAGTVERVDVAPGQRVERAQPLVHGREGVVD